MTNDQIVHGQRIANRRAVNGQPNGYRPVSEAELQLAKALGIDTKMLEDKHLLDPDFDKFEAA